MRLPFFPGVPRWLAFLPSTPFLVALLTFSLAAPLWWPLAITLFWTQLLEGSVAGLIGWWRGEPIQRWVGWILLLNSVTQPLLWWGMATGGTAVYWPTLLLLEAAIWLGEGVGLYGLSRRALPLQQAILLSILLNAISFGIGLWL